MIIENEQAEIESIQRMVEAREQDAYARGVRDGQVERVDGRELPVCAECGSDDVQADAFAVWDAENQSWELGATFSENSYCQSCEAKCELEWVPVDEEAV